jgi:pyruvate/2-oxoglutarate dehydrogenase complex dihydrolipoamide acyltransferase (E2) component
MITGSWTGRRPVTFLVRIKEALEDPARLVLDL